MVRLRTGEDGGCLVDADAVYCTNRALPTVDGAPVSKA